MSERPINRAARQALAVSAVVVIGFAVVLMFVQLGPPGG